MALVIYISVTFIVDVVYILLTSQSWVFQINTFNGYFWWSNPCCVMIMVNRLLFYLRHSNAILCITLGVNSFVGDPVRPNSSIPQGWYRIFQMGRPRENGGYLTWSAPHSGSGGGRDGVLPPPVRGGGVVWWPSPGFFRNNPSFWCNPRLGIQGHFLPHIWANLS